MVLDDPLAREGPAKSASCVAALEDVRSPRGPAESRRTLGPQITPPRGPEFVVLKKSILKSSALGLPENPSKKVGEKPPTFSMGFPVGGGRLDTTNR